MIHHTRWRGSFTRYNWTTLWVYHALKMVEAVIFLGTFGWLSADDWASKWLFDRDDD